MPLAAADDNATSYRNVFDRCSRIESYTMKPFADASPCLRACVDSRHLAPLCCSYTRSTEYKAFSQAGDTRGNAEATYPR